MLLLVRSFLWVLVVSTTSNAFQNSFFGLPRSNAVRSDHICQAHASNSRRQSFGSMIANVFLPATAAGAKDTANTSGKSKTNSAEKIKKEFPGALTNSDFVSKMTRTLTRDFGFKTSKTLLATSLCCDEVNRSLEHCLEKVYGQNYFVLGGLAGFPFAGITGLQAMASHVPDGGSALIIYGPHVGIDANGNVGSIDRRGREKAGACCGSAVAAARSVLANSQKKSNGKRSPSSTDDHILSSQQQDVEDIVRTYADHLRSIDDPMVELPYCLFESQSKLMDELVESSLVTGNSIPVAMVGGIQINTDIGQPDYFLPIRFEVRDASGVVASGGI